MKLPNCLKNLNSRKGNEKGSVTLFVLIAMLFFLMIGMMIFIINMNTETSQKRDVEKIKSEYNANTSETDLDQLYQEAKQRQIGTFMIKLIDKYGKIYNSGEWVNEKWLAEGRLPLTVQPNFPEGLKDISVTVKDDTYGGSTIITKTADLATMEIRADKDCQYTIENTLDNTNQVKINIDTTKPTIDELKGGTIWKGTEEEEITGTDAGGAITITARDNLSGVKELKYIINNSPEAPSADAEWTTVEGATAQVTINNENDLGVYYIHAMATDVAGNVRDVVTSGPYEVKQANYKITTTTGTTYSETLKDAAEKPGAMVIKVLNTFTDEVPATIAQNVTIDTNGKTLTMAETITVAANTTATFVDTAETKGKLQRTTGNLITNNGTVKVGTQNSTNGAILESKDCVIYGASGDVEVNSGKLNVTGKGQWTTNYTTIWAKNITIRGGEVNNDYVNFGIIGLNNINITGGKVNGKHCGIHNGSSGGTLNISGNTEITGKDAGIMGYSVGATINISGESKITSEGEAINIYANSTTINITGGTISGTVGIYSRAESSGHNITISGGTITGTATRGIGLESSSSTLSVTGGTITGETKGIVLTGANSTLTIGNNQNALDRTTPIITGTNGYSVEMTGATSTFNFYDGKLIGGTKALASEEKRTFFGREMSFNLANDTTANFLTETEGNATRRYLPYTRENSETHKFETVLEKEVKVTFNKNAEDATCTETERNVLTNVEYKELAGTAQNDTNVTYSNLPRQTGLENETDSKIDRTGYTFKGWNGKNKLDLSKYVADTQYVKVDNEKIRIIRTDENVTFRRLIKHDLENGKLYTITANISGNYSQRIYAFFGWDLWASKINGNSILNKFNYNSGDDKGGLAIFQGTGTNISMILDTDEVEISNIMLVEGNTAAPYEPYWITDTTKVVQDTDHTLTAIWEANKYTVHFDKNDSQEAPVTGEMSDQEFTYGQEQALTTNAYTRTGYTFKGWNTAADGSGTAYTDGQVVSNLTTENGVAINLYAQWMENNYLNTTTNKYYGTLTDALADIPVFNDGDTVQTIEVQNSRTEPASKAPILAANKKAIIDLKGQTTTLNSTLTNNGTLEIKDTATGGTITRDGDVVTNKANLTLSSGNLIPVSGYGISNSKILTVTGGKINGTNGIFNDTTGNTTISGETTEIIGTTYGIHNYKNAELSISGGRVNGDYIGLYNNNNTNIIMISGGEITGGVRTSGGGAAINGGSINISNNAKIKGIGYWGIVSKGNITVTGGEITAIGTAICYIGNGTTIIGSLYNSVSKTDPIIKSAVNGGANIPALAPYGEVNPTIIFLSGKIVETKSSFTEDSQLYFGSLNCRVENEGTENEVRYSPVTTKNGDYYETVLERQVKVTADANGGKIKTTPEGWTAKEENTKADKTMLTNTTYGTLPEVERTGYTFKGWNGKNLFNTANIISGKNVAVNEDGSVYATNTNTDNRSWLEASNDCWKTILPAGTYTVSFELKTQTTPVSAAFQVRNNDKNKVISQTSICNVDNAKSTFVLTEQTEIGIMMKLYEGVANVQLEQGSTVTPYEPYYISSDTPVTTDADHTITAIWEATPYAVTLNAGDGTIDAGDDGWARAGDNKTATKDITYDSNYGTLPTASKTGYTFDGWYTDATNGTQITDVSIMQTASEQSLYAHWTANNYTIHFDANGGTGEMADLPMTYGTPANLTANAFSRTGYKFVKWTSNADGTGNEYIDGQTVNNLTEINNDTVNLFAQWEERPFVVTFNPNGGIVTPESKEITYNSTYGDLPSGDNIKRLGYTFAGWYKEAELTNEVTAETTYDITEDSTLYAKWTPHVYTVTFNKNGGTGTMSDQSFTYGQTQNLRANTFTRTGYTFAGWARAENGTVEFTNEQSISNLTPENGGTITLYAVWNDVTRPSWSVRLLDIINK